ncbi:5-(carboxyamino)imidazole ribonucleotide synthase [Microaerobacter geothermalis]|uniref:5-(carboxyamino)imidazole ribonucleotide synthase n=1 Tax=Microaerobacter geothermalis TaxID=674972 RepID=UPI001F24A7E6|nr:5-(carboxyamino)imidazole ribonucleotide synthase [Microaerobacter geothermalis]MCF6094492.1 5-(carboxyamino)imidazole ribonucleotide synthase [Microaerobacter geothermalis]
MSVDKKTKTILPGSTIGILGGGQLGRMMALEGRRMGYQFITLDPTENSPCGQVADYQFVASYDDVEQAKEMASRCDVITYEFENVSSLVAEALGKHSFVPQGSRLLFFTQHRIREKEALMELKVPVAPFHVIRSRQDLFDGLKAIGTPSILKTATGGYDGKGQIVLKKPEDAESAFQLLVQHDRELILEQFVPFEKEISVIVARRQSGEMEFFPVAENIHRNNILHQSLVPARIGQRVESEAREIGKRIAEGLQVVGLIAVEMFLTGDGRIYVNELAPRPHNSGHYTYDACVTSQFEQHLRAICNLPLGSTQLLSPVVMVNILGEHVNQVVEKIAEFPPNIKIHLYGKKGAKPKRKMGHLNVLAETTEVALQIIDQLKIWKKTEDVR